MPSNQLDKIKYCCYLLVGIHLILFSNTYARNGHTTVLTGFETNPIDLIANTVFQYVWDIISVEKLISWIAVLFMASIHIPVKADCVKTLLNY